MQLKYNVRKVGEAIQNLIVCYTEVLAILVGAYPKAIGVEELARRTQRSKHELRHVMHQLLEQELVKPSETQNDRWHLACEPDQVTLESVWACTVSGMDVGGFVLSSHMHGVENFLVPAVMLAMQNMSTTLRQFSLDRMPKTTSDLPHSFPHAFRKFSLI